MKSYKIEGDDEMLITELVEHLHRKIANMTQGESIDLKIRRVI